MARGAREGLLALGHGFVGMVQWVDVTPNVLFCRRPALLLGQNCFVGAFSLRWWVFDLLRWLCFAEGLRRRRDGCALLEACFLLGRLCLVSPLKRLLAGNASVLTLGLLLARRLLVAPLGAVARSSVGAVVHPLETSVLRYGTRALGEPTYPLGQGIRICRSSCACCTCDPDIIIGICFVPRVFVGNSSTSHCVVALKCKVDPWEIPSFSARPTGCRAWGTLNFGSKPSQGKLEPSPIGICDSDRSDRTNRASSRLFKCPLNGSLIPRACLEMQINVKEHLKESVCCPGSGSVAIAEGGFGPFFNRQRDRAGSPVVGGLRHAMLVGAVACDLSWREGDRTSLVGVVRGCRGCVHGCAERRVRSRDDAWLHGVREKLALPRKVHRSSGHDSLCCGGRVKIAISLPAKKVFTHLHVGLSELPLRSWLVDQFLIFINSLSAKMCRSWFAKTRWDPRVLTDFVEARTRGQARCLLPRRKEDRLRTRQHE
ncbi:hypothetical protein CRG98_031404 [Punica granatum]|uniref:Uncharacterized protein n=1 Tax=Punica granatum TaxID=22663 RepID=A0A2I0IW46_PUNGR|nr:hypothetical protein CRG98_031404 [Punica granatum]